LKKAHTGFLDSEPSLSAVRCGRHEEPGWPRCHRLSWVHRPRRKGARARAPSRKQAQGGCGPQAQPRTRPCAPWWRTGAGYSRGQGDGVRKDGWTGNGRHSRRPQGKRSAQARSWKPGRRRQPSGARGRWKPVRGETPKGARCAARQRDRPCFLAGDALHPQPTKH